MITAEEIASLEATLLPALERHHLRLLAHGLRTLQLIAGRRQGDPPSAATIQAWVLQQPATAGDAGFAAAFGDQLVGLAEQLRQIAAPTHQALALDLPDLVAWAQRQADARLAPRASAPQA